MDMKKAVRNVWLGNRVLLGLLMVVPGLFKLFFMGAPAVSGMLATIGFAAPTFFAWVLIIAEILSGVLILANYKVQYVVVLPVIILLVAGFTVYLTNYPTLLLHLAVVSNYVLLGVDGPMHSRHQ